MGIWDRWEAVLDMYRDVNTLFGDVVKVGGREVGREGGLGRANNMSSSAVAEWLVHPYSHPPSLPLSLFVSHLSLTLSFTPFSGNALLQVRG